MARTTISPFEKDKQATGHDIEKFNHA